MIVWEIKLDHLYNEYDEIVDSELSNSSIDYCKARSAMSDFLVSNNEQNK